MATPTPDSGLARQKPLPMNLRHTKAEYNRRIPGIIARQTEYDVATLEAYGKMVMDQKLENGDTVKKEDMVVKEDGVKKENGVKENGLKKDENEIPVYRITENGPGFGYVFLFLCFLYLCAFHCFSLSSRHVHNHRVIPSHPPFLIS